MSKISERMIPGRGFMGWGEARMLKGLYLDREGYGRLRLLSNIITDKKLLDSK